MGFECSCAQAGGKLEYRESGHVGRDTHFLEAGADFRTTHMVVIERLTASQIRSRSPPALRETVPQSVRMNFFADAGTLGRIFAG